MAVKAYANLKTADSSCIPPTAQLCMSSDHRDRRGFYYYFVFHLIEMSYYLYGNLLYIYDDIHMRVQRISDIMTTLGHGQKIVAGR